MNLNNTELLHKFSIAVFFLLLLISEAAAITQYNYDNLRFITSFEVLKPSLPLAFRDSIVTVRIPLKKFETRLKKGKEDTRIEPLTIYLPKDYKKLTRLVKELAQPGKKKKLTKIFLEKLRNVGATNSNQVKIYLSPKNLRYIDTKKLIDELTKNHHNVYLKASSLSKNKNLQRKFMSQIKYFIPRPKRIKILRKIRAGKNVSLERNLLPNFAKKMVRKFLIYRGPNCFHAALAFHGTSLTRSQFINIKEEKGYHRAMINYDELWRVINRHFYEVDASKYPLKYGDMLVFFNIPKEPFHSVSFRWIRHTAIYLFGPYTFSKGSKSPDTPYTVKTIPEEWKTWLGYTTNLGVKVFRRNSRILEKKPPKDLVDWIY